jgi:hypothetical protein
MQPESKSSPRTVPLFLVPIITNRDLPLFVGKSSANMTEVIYRCCAVGSWANQYPPEVPSRRRSETPPWSFEYPLTIILRLGKPGGNTGKDMLVTMRSNNIFSCAISATALHPHVLSELRHSPQRPRALLRGSLGVAMFQICVRVSLGVYAPNTVARGL